jgi:vitamin K-dependent gamma-carboxylase
LIFFSPSWPRLLLARVGRTTRAPPPDKALPAASLSPPAKLVTYVIAFHVALQIALPLRHVVYPGEVLWNEDGMRFAWHVVVREKQGSVMFVARFPNGKLLEIPPSHYLTARQEREMAGQPDLILQLAREIGDDLHAQGYGSFELHARTGVSLNGRAPHPLIDPEVDLLQVSDAGERGWVLAAPVEPPPHVVPFGRAR